MLVHRSKKKKKKESSLLRSRSFAVEEKGAVDKHGRSSNTASAVDERKPTKKKKMVQTVIAMNCNKIHTHAHFG